MTRIITFILALVTAISVNAQNYTYNFSSTPLSEALLLISREHPELSIHFIYNELEDYTTSARVSTIDPYEAVRRTVGLNPVSVLQQGNNFYLEAMQHGKYRYKGKVTGSDGEAVAAATVILLEPKDSTVLTYGITTDDGRFLIPCDNSPEARDLRLQLKWDQSMSLDETIDMLNNFEHLNIHIDHGTIIVE